MSRNRRKDPVSQRPFPEESLDTFGAIAPVIRLRKDNIARTREMLGKREERIDFLAEILKSSPVSVIATDGDAKIIYCNPAVEKLYGYQEDELIGNNSGILNAESNAPEIQSQVLDTVGRGRVWRGEILNRKKNGDLVYVRTSIYKLLDKQGDFMAYVGFHEDITERRRVEDALKESEEKYRTIFENTGTATLIIEEDTSISLVNTEFEKLTGYSKGEVEGKKSWAEFVMKDDLERLKEYHDNRRIDPNGVPRNHELKVIDRRGNIRDVFLTADLIPGTKKSVVSALDITEHKRMVEALGENERRYRLLAENVTDVIWTMDLMPRFTYISPSIKLLLGYRIEEAMARTVEQILAPRSLEVAMKVLAEELAAEKKEGVDPSRSRVLELELNRKDGSTVWAEVRVTFLRDADGTPSGILGVARDISERKLAEEELRKSQEKLDTMLGSIGDHMSMMDKDLNIIWANQIAKRIFGYDIVGRKCYQAYHRRKRPCESCITLKAFQDEKVHEHDTQVTNKQGKSLYFHCSANVALRDKEGRPVAVIEISRDITKQKQGEESIKRRNLELSLLNTIACTISHTVEIDTMLDEALNKLLELMSIDFAAICLGSDEKWRMASGPGCEASGSLREMVQAISLDDPLLQPVVAQGKPIVLAGLPELNGRNRHERRGRFALIPITSKNIVRGVLIVHGQDVSTFAPHEVELLTTVGSQIGVAVVNAWLYQELKTQRDFSMQLIDTMPDGMGIFDEKGRLEFGNRRLFGMLSYLPEEISDAHWTELFHSNDHALVKAQSKSRKRTESFAFECRLLRKDGISLPVLISWAPRLDDQGRYQGALAVLTDVTEYKRAEEALRKSEHEKNAILNSMCELVVYQDTDHRVIWGNAVAHESAGLAPEQLRGRRCYETWHGRSKPCVGCPVTKARKTGQPQEGEMTTPDGKIWVVRGYPVRGASGEIEGVVEVVLNVTERKLAEERLREYEARYSHLLDNLPDGVALTRNRRIMRANSSLSVMFGYHPSPEKMEGLFLWDLAAVGSKMNMRRQSALRALGYGGKNRFEFQALRMDGSLFPAEITLTVDRGEHRRFVLAIIRDLSEREEHERLRRRLSERILKAQERDRASIARELHDELGQALTGIKMDMAWIKSHVKSPDEAVSDRLEALENLTDAILESVREMAVSLRPSVLDRLGLGAALEWYAREFERRTGIECVIESESPDFNTDSDVAINAYRIFQEALTNIARHAGASRVDVRMAEDGRYFTISISDNGKGIPSQKLSGTMSLGIAGMRERAELVKGRLDIRRRRPKGTKVTTYFPLSPNSPTKRSEA